MNLMCEEINADMKKRLLEVILFSSLLSLLE